MARPACLGWGGAPEPKRVQLVVEWCHLGQGRLGGNQTIKLLHLVWQLHLRDCEWKGLHHPELCGAWLAHGSCTHHMWWDGQHLHANGLSLDGCESCHLLCKDLGPQASYNLVACDSCDLWSGGRQNLQPDQDLQVLSIHQGRPECGSLVVEVLVSACASHHQVIHLLTAQHDGSWHAFDILPTLQGEGDELYGATLYGNLNLAC